MNNMDKPVLKLAGVDGNAFMVLGAALKAAKKAQWTQEQIDTYKTEAMKGDYDNFLQVTMKYFEVE